MAYLKHLSSKVDILPPQPEEFSETHTRSQCQDIQRFEAITLGSIEEGASLRSRERLDLVALHPRGTHQCNHIPRHSPPFCCLPQSTTQHGMELADGGRSKALGQTVSVEPLHMARL